MSHSHISMKVAAAAALCLGAASAHAALTSNTLNLNALTFNALTFNALTSNAITVNALSFNALTRDGSALGELNGVAVEAVTLPERAAGNATPGTQPGERVAIGSATLGSAAGLVDDGSGW